MEEKKLVVGADKAPKVSEEEYRKVCSQRDQLQGYIEKLHVQIEQMGAILNSKRLDYLMRVIELGDKIKDSDFITSCIDEVKDALTVHEEESGENGETGN